MKDIIVVIGAGAIGIAIARRIGSGKHILLADVRQENVEKVGEQLYNAGFAYSTTTVDVTSRTSVEALAEKANAMGRITTLIHAAGVSPSQATPEVILKVDLYGTALVLEVFGN